MASQYDTTDFVDTDFQAHKSPYGTASATTTTLRAPTREEVHERARERFEPAFGMTPEAMDAAWRAQVGGRRRK